MKIKYYSLVLLLAIAGSGCKKYLEAKSSQSLVVISNLGDLQALLDNWSVINLNTAGSDEVSTDEYYLPYATYLALSLEQQRNMYTWQPDNLYQPYVALNNDWNVTYNNVYIANTVLDHMADVARTAANAAAWDNVKGQALFLRGYALYKAASVWALAYDAATSATDLGVPLRLNADFNEKSTRAPVSETYRQLTADLRQASSLLAVTAVHPYRAARPAAFAALARVCLAMRDYAQAGLYADSALQLKPTLIDYNTLAAGAAFPLAQFNAEVLYDSSMDGQGAAPVSATRAKIDSNLYASYASADLRKTVFFTVAADRTVVFKGSYEGSVTRFNGLATDEQYLIRAECEARTGDLNAALRDLNTLLQFRYAKAAFVPVTAASAAEALTKILTERQKELLMRGTRWMDIKRLNKEGAAISLKRILNGMVYTLPAGDPRFALALPDDIIALSGMPQNPR